MGASPDSYRIAWRRKPVLRAIYEDFSARIAARVPPGPVLELGGGSGNLNEILADVVSTDIVSAPWLDVVADAQAIPFADGSFNAIVMVDVLHHLARPKRFLAEAGRILRPGGRVVMIEPGITPASRLFFRLFHPEPVRMDVDPLGDAPLSDPRDPWDANQALPTLLFKRQAVRYAQAFPNLALREARWLSLFAYPLSGGFRPWSLLSAGMVKPLLALEDLVMPVLGPVMAFRLLVVLERAP